MKCLILLSGGIDSPVAAHLLKEKGLEVKGIHFSNEPFTDNTPELKAKKCADLLGMDFMVENIGKDLEAIAKNCDHKYYFVLQKRCMLRKAEKITKKQKIDFIATGESLAQVSSQTLQNLYCIDNAVSIPVLRPLIGLDKEEIIKIAKQINTYEMSTGPEMCDVLGPKHPATQAKLETILEEEEKIKS